MPRRRHPVTAAELLGAQLRARCGKCILWILGLLAMGYGVNHLNEGLKSLTNVVEAREAQLQR